MYLFGSGAELGDWDPADAVPGSAIGYSEERPLWSFEVELPANTSLGYAYVRREPDGAVLFETRNRTLDVPLCGGQATQEDAWVGPVGVPPR